MVSHGRVELLAHPLSQKYLQMKWNSYGKYFHLANVLFYSIFLGFVTYFSSYELMTNEECTFAANASNTVRMNKIVTVLKSYNPHFFNLSRIYIWTVLHTSNFRQRSPNLLIFVLISSNISNVTYRVLLLHFNPIGSRIVNLVNATILSRFLYNNRRNKNNNKNIIY